MIMKTAKKLVKTKRNPGELISRLPGIEILDLDSMMHVRGGEGDNSFPVVIPPRPPV
jgi:hypothetical protein